LTWQTLLGLFCHHSAGISNIAMDEETIPELPHIEGSPLVSLEHFNINVGAEWNDDLQAFWFEVLLAGVDSRTAEVMRRQSVKKLPLHWANFGLQQAHLPCQPAGCYEKMAGLGTWTNKQKMRGLVGMEWPASTWAELVARLEAAAGSGALPLTGGLKIIDKTEQMIEFLAVNGNRFRIVPMKESHYIGPKFPLPAESTKCLPGTRPAGLGIRYLEYFVPSGGRVLECIAKTYEVVLGAKVRRSEVEKKIEVLIGISENPQFIKFIEKDVVEPYEGDHLCIYVNDFMAMYNRAKSVKIGSDNSNTLNIVWNNPCFTMKYDTWEKVKQLNEFRFKDFLNLETGEVVYQLEHEVRSLAHPGFQINKDTFL